MNTIRTNVSGDNVSKGNLLTNFVILGSIMMDQERQEEQMRMHLEARCKLFENDFGYANDFQKLFDDYLNCRTSDWKDFCIQVCKRVEDFRRSVTSLSNSIDNTKIDDLIINHIAYGTFLSFAEVCSEAACEAGTKMCLGFAKDFMMREAPEGFGKHNGNALPNDHPFLDWWDKFAKERESILEVLEREIYRVNLVMKNSVGGLLSAALAAKKAG